MTKKNPVLIEDTTLREGEQTSGLIFSEKAKHEITQALAAAGITHIEVGIPTMGGQEARAISGMIGAYPDLTLIGWNRGVKEDLSRSIDAGFRAIHIGLPSSSTHIADLYGKSENWVVDTALSLIDHARANGVRFISVSAEDMGRADLAFLQKYAAAVFEGGATRLRLSDTIGCLTPGRVAEIVRGIKERSPIPLQLHMHNDLGLAVANVLGGIEAGAEQVHVTVNGLGERAGITSLHQAAVAIQVMAGVETGVRLDHLPGLSALVARFSGFPVPHNEPVVGSHVFTHESGIHVNGMLALSASFQTYDPRMVGREHAFVLGKHTGSQAICHILASAGVAVSRDEARDLLPAFRDLAIELGGCIPPAVAALFARQWLQPRRDTPQPEN